MELKANVPGWERGVRLALGLVLVSLVFWGPKTLWGLVGIVPIATALVAWCPAYAVLGVRRH